MTEPNDADEVLAAVKGPPAGYFVVVPRREPEQLLDFGAMLASAVRAWKTLLAAALIAAIIAAAIALQLPNIYRASVLAAPVTQSGMGTSSVRDQFGGLAALAGINLNAADGRKQEAFATLASTSFARDFIKDENLLPILFADRWDANGKRWRPGEPEPTLEAGVTRFVNDVRFVEENAQTGLVTLSVEWRSPQLAAQWANRMIERVNERLRANARRDAERSIEYLNSEAGRTNVVELRQAIYRLIEAQVNNAMLANVQRQYAFRVIDPAVPPELRAKPRRSLIVVLGAMIGGFLALIVVLLPHRPWALRAAMSRR